MTDERPEGAPSKKVRQCARCGKLRSEIDPNAECVVPNGMNFTRHVIVDVAEGDDD